MIEFSSAHPRSVSIDFSSARNASAFTCTNAGADIGAALGAALGLSSRSRGCTAVVSASAVVPAKAGTAAATAAM